MVVGHCRVPSTGRTSLRFGLEWLRSVPQTAIPVDELVDESPETIEAARGVSL